MLSHSYVVTTELKSIKNLVYWLQFMWFVVLNGQTRPFSSLYIMEHFAVLPQQWGKRFISCPMWSSPYESCGWLFMPWPLLFKYDSSVVVDNNVGASGPKHRAILEYSVLGFVSILPDYWNDIISCQCADSRVLLTTGRVVFGVQVDLHTRNSDYGLNPSYQQLCILVLGCLVSLQRSYRWTRRRPTTREAGYSPRLTLGPYIMSQCEWSNRWAGRQWYHYYGMCAATTWNIVCCYHRKYFYARWRAEDYAG